MIGEVGLHIINYLMRKKIKTKTKISYFTLYTESISDDLRSER